MWSGGLDSTALIWNYLKSGHNVTAGYFAIRNNVCKIRCELRAIDRMLPFLERYRFKFNGVMGWFKWNYGGNINFKRPECPIWISVCAMLTEPYDEIGVGYVLEDNVTRSDMAGFQRLFKSLQQLSHCHNKLAYPLWRTPKQKLFNDLPPELRRFLWTCEDPQGKSPYRPCGRCHSCRQANSYEALR